MGEIPNPRHGRFAQELAAANPADAAYEAAGYRKHRGNAARLSANGQHTVGDQFKILHDRITRPWRRLDHLTSHQVTTEFNER
jgi:hypothetical protein